MANVAKDPVCGMAARAEEGFVVFHQGETYAFCSDLCKQTFLADP